MNRNQHSHHSWLLIFPVPRRAMLRLLKGVIPALLGAIGDRRVLASGRCRGTRQTCDRAADCCSRRCRRGACRCRADGDPCPGGCDPTFSACRGCCGGGCDDGTCCTELGRTCPPGCEENEECADCCGGFCAIERQCGMR